jgi:hypothetical protein
MIPSTSSTTTTGIVSLGAAIITSRPARAAEPTITSREVSSIGASTAPIGSPGIGGSVGTGLDGP